ncbi:MAG TPA: hypothetical protein VHF22_11150 [Planctomycetota bacterium]|nr:hypothetical protein [Planctomycetota bacterium]
MARARPALARRGLAALLAVAGALAAASPARAEVWKGLNIENFKPALDPFGYATVNGARSLDPLHFHVQGVFNWARNPIEFAEPPPGKDTEIVRDLAVLDLGGSVGVLPIGKTGGLELGVNVPLVLVESGTRVDSLDGDFSGFGVGSVRTDAKLTFTDRDRPDWFPVGLAVRAFAEWATGQERDLLSDDGHNAYGVTAIVERRLLGRLRLGVEVGYEYIEGRGQVAGITYDDKLLLGGGAAVDVIELWSIYAEAFHWARIGNLWKHEAEAPLEGDVGVKRSGGRLYIEAGVGAGGLVHGAGAPDLRVHAAVGFTF